MRPMAGDSQHQVLMVCRHCFDLCADLPPEPRGIFLGCFVCISRRRPYDRDVADGREKEVNRLLDVHLVLHLDYPKNTASAFTTSRFASSVPTDMRSAWGSL